MLVRPGFQRASLASPFLRTAAGITITRPSSSAAAMASLLFGTSSLRSATTGQAATARTLSRSFVANGNRAAAAGAAPPPNLLRGATRCTSAFSTARPSLPSLVRGGGTAPFAPAVARYTSGSGAGQPPPPPPPKKGGGGRLAQGMGLLGAASVLAGKSKYLLGALKVTKLASLGSMVLTVGTYSMFFGLPYAAGMVGLIFVHETGHALVLVNRGIPFHPAVYVPFMGAVIATKKLPRDAWEDALIAAGGPVLGSLGAGAVAVAANATDSQLLYALADFGFMINLFNLLPIGSMDGGRIAGAISPYAGVAGLGLGGLMAYNGVVHNPIFYLILLAGGYDTFQRFYNPQAHTPPNYYKITTVQRAAITAGYFGMIAALIAAMAANHRYQKPPEVLVRERELEKTWDMR